MRIKFFLILLIVTFFITGCKLDPYRDSKYGEMAIDSWFNSEVLGDARKNAENINEIVSRECEFVTSKLNKYVFRCRITYKEKGETVIPLSKNSVIDVYSVFIKKDGKKFDYKVYNSKYTKEDSIWEKDEYLDY